MSTLIDEHHGRKPELSISTIETGSRKGGEGGGMELYREERNSHNWLLNDRQDECLKLELGHWPIWCVCSGKHRSGPGSDWLLDSQNLVASPVVGHRGRILTFRTVYVGFPPFFFLFLPLSAFATSLDSHVKDFKTVPVLITISSFSLMAVLGLHKPEKGIG